MQPPPPGFPQWGSPPPDPREPNEPGYSGQPTPASYGQQPLPPGYGAPRPPGPGSPPAGYGQQPGYGPQQWNSYAAPFPAPTSQQKIGWITFAIVGLLGLLGAVLTLTLWINLDSAVNRAGEMCDRFSGEYARSCRQSVKNLVPRIPVALVVCVFLIIGGLMFVPAFRVLLGLPPKLTAGPVPGGGQWPYGPPPPPQQFAPPGPPPQQW